MTLVVFTNLMKELTNCSDDDTSDIKHLIFPKLTNFCKFMFNLGIYIACYPDTNIENAKDNEANELFSFDNILCLRMYYLKLKVWNLI